MLAAGGAHGTRLLQQVGLVDLASQRDQIDQLPDPEQPPGEQPEKAGSPLAQVEAMQTGEPEQPAGPEAVGNALLELLLGLVVAHAWPAVWFISPGFWGPPGSYLKRRARTLPEFQP